MSKAVEKVVEVLVYDRSNSTEDFETFLLRVVERLKALRYCGKIVIKIVRGVGDLQVNLESLSTSNHRGMLDINEKTYEAT